jgi:hypothetical protein
MGGCALSSYFPFLGPPHISPDATRLAKSPKPSPYSSADTIFLRFIVGLKQLVSVLGYERIPL